MSAINRTNLGKLGLADYPGHIFICKIRYGYGSQQIIEKLEILHSWFSDLRAYLPMHFKLKDGTTDKKYQEFVKPLEDVNGQISAAYNIYDGSFEGQTCNPKEKELLKAMRGIKERLDVITAESEVIKGVKNNDGELEIG